MAFNEALNSAGHFLDTRIEKGFLNLIPACLPVTTAVPVNEKETPYSLKDNRKEKSSAENP